MELEFDKILEESNSVRNSNAANDSNDRQRQSRATQKYSRATTMRDSEILTVGSFTYVQSLG